MRKRSGRTAQQKRRAAPKRDANQTAFDALQEVIRRTEGTGKDPIAVLLGQRGGKKGGAARVAKMTKEELRASAIKAARARWAKKDGK